MDRHIVEDSMFYKYGKTCVKRPLKNRQNKYLYDKWELNEGQKYFSILQYFWPAFRLHSTIRFSIADNVSILKPCSKTVHTKYTKPASF